MDSCFICGSGSIEILEDKAKVHFKCPTCEEVVIVSTIRRKISEMADDERLLLSAYFRKNRNKPAPAKMISSKDLVQILNEMKSLKPSTPMEARNRVIEYFGKKSGPMGSWVRSDYNTHRDIVLEKEALRFVMDGLIEDGILEVKHAEGNYLAKGELRLSLDGWNRFEEIYRQQLNSKQAFIAMNFDESCLDIWQQAIFPAFETTDFKPYRVDEDRHIKNINNKIIAEIRKSRFVVAEFTGHKHGVYFEAGFAMGLGIPVIWICKESDFAKTHFDTKHFNHIVWKDYEELKEELRWFIEANIH